MTESKTATRTWSMRERTGIVARVRAISGPAKGARCAFSGAPVVVGSGDGAGLRLDDPAVSRLHCELRLTPSGEAIAVRDLKSKNGVWLEGCRLLLGEVRVGGHLRVGDTVLHLEAGPDTVLDPVYDGGDTFQDLLGGTAVMQRLFAEMAQIAEADDPVLLLGEAGVGRESVARALHASGARAAGPFEYVAGGALSSTLADLELFGCVRGAFTGAVTDRAGVFERGAGGTVYLDEIDEIPLHLQPRLLRVLESGTVRRLGTNEDVPVDARVVASARRPLEERVNEGAFREDLYYRLAVHVLRVPPLRERRADIPRLAERLLATLTNEPGRQAALAAFLREMDGHAWPGNLLELRAAVRRLALLGDAGPRAVEPGDTLYIDPREPLAEGKQRWLDAFHTQYLRALLHETGGRVGEAAERAGVHRSHLSKLMRELGLRDE